MNFKDKVVVITGAAGGLGRAVAAKFEAAEASTVMLDVAHDLLVKAFPDQRATRLTVPTNLMDIASVTAAIDAAMARFGQIDVLCNVAGGFRMGTPVHQTPPETWNLMMDLNAGTVLNTARAVVPRMLATGGGKIINIAAVGGTSGRPLMGAYSASKSVVIRLTESMAAELREQRINVNCVLPSIIDTPPNRAAMPDADASRWVTPDALADVILFLASDAARAIHGAAIPVVGLS
jgi:NAD(P)-dependent dehydrogenase (short-subunit alcohol dehydrogenase family)